MAAAGDRRVALSLRAVHVVGARHHAVVADFLWDAAHGVRDVVAFVHRPDGQRHVILSAVLEEENALAVGFRVKVLLDHAAGFFRKAGHIVLHSGNPPVLPHVVDRAVIVHEQARVNAGRHRFFAHVLVWALGLSRRAFQKTRISEQAEGEALQVFQHPIGSTRLRSSVLTRSSSLLPKSR